MHAFNTDTSTYEVCNIIEDLETLMEGLLVWTDQVRKIY